MNAKTKSLIGNILPALGGLFVTYLYNVVDGIFVGRGVGAAALGGSESRLYDGVFPDAPDVRSSYDSRHGLLPADRGLERCEKLKCGHAADGGAVSALLLCVFRPDADGHMPFRVCAQ